MDATIMRSCWRTEVIAFGFALLAATPTTATPEEWPTRTVTMVVPFAAGSGVDVLGRMLAPRLSEILGQQVIVENVGGAGGMIGASRVAKAASDGYEFVLGNVGTHAYNQTFYQKPLYNAVTDFAPVVLIAEQPVVLIARRDLPIKNLCEFISYAKANRTEMKFGSAGVGSAAHLSCALLNSAIGIDVTHIPYRGGAPAMQDLIAGRIDYQCPLAAIAIPHIRSNQVKAIAILADKRSSSLPDLATAREQGLISLETTTWNAFFFPASTPPAIVRKLHDATVAAMETPAVQKRLREIGFDLVTPNRRFSEYLATFVASEVQRWAGPIKAAGVTGD
jgi:tripartite-type tricarboxylate transporter receptor subunit TctC